MTFTPRLFRRAAFFALLLVIETALVSFFFGVPMMAPDWANPVVYVSKLVQLGLVAFPAFLLLAYPERERYLAAWAQAAGARNLRMDVFVNLAIFSVLLTATIAYSASAHAAGEPSLGWFAIYCCILLTTAWSLSAVAAPPAFWLWIVKDAAAKIAVAVGTGIAILILSETAKSGWDSLSGATLAVSHAILSLYETGVTIDPERQLLGAGNFEVLIGPPCSGYDGIGLVLAFTGLYLWIFRRDLRFPAALLLLPVGAVAVWLLNAVRIAVLISIGAHVSPSIAVEGFHSQAGWVAFLAVTLGLIVISRRVPLFNRRHSGSPAAGITIRPSARSDDRTMLAYLAPFMALMASAIVAAMFAPHDAWLYPLKVAVVGLTVWMFRRHYTGLMRGVSPIAIITGAAVGVVWIASAPVAGETDATGAWLAAQPVYLAVIWLLFRAVGSIILVPVAEELAFRGYLHRALIAPQFEAVSPGQFSLLAFVVSSVLFGLMHERWLAAMLAGAVFALLIYRGNRLADPIAAHMVANAVILAWAIVMQQWSLI